MGHSTSDNILNRHDVVSAFSRNGIRLGYMGKSDGIHNYVDASFFPAISSKDPWIEIEIFPALLKTD